MTIDIDVPILTPIGRDTVAFAQAEIVRQVGDDTARGAYLCGIAAFVLSAIERLQGQPARTAELINEMLTEAKSPLRVSLMQ